MELLPGSSLAALMASMSVEGLTYTFLDPSAWMFFDTMVHNSKDNSYLAVYDIERTATSANECWGLIYK